MDIKPIRSDADHTAAVERANEIWGAEPGTPEGDELDILIPLIEAYEKKRFPIPPPDPIEAILFRMDQMGLERKDLVPIFGTRGRLSEVINRRRPLTLRMIRALHAELHIPAHVLLASYRLKPRRRRRRDEVTSQAQM